MARPRSKRVTLIKQHLIEDLNKGVYQSGDRIPSARNIANEFKISYQTAHRLLSELSAEGYVIRRLASGTYVPGGLITREGALAGAADGVPTEVALILSRRARRTNSFGARLLAGLAEQLRRKSIPWHVEWAEGIEEESDMPGPDSLPVLWEAPLALDYCRRSGRRALLLNAKPRPGLTATLIDSVSLDDYFGGCLAAELLAGNALNAHGYAIVTGPDDPRSNDRRDGFLSRVPNASAISAGGWYVEDGKLVAQSAIDNGPAGIFCVNDRLGQAILECAIGQGRTVRVVGFDNAPIAAELNLTTIAIPWAELVADVMQIVQRRLCGDNSAARRHLITPIPITRASCR